MTIEIRARYGGTVSVEEVAEGWRLTCCDTEGEITVVYLSGRDAQQLTDALRYTPAQTPTGGVQ
jgi:hypothetical protein